MNFSEEATRSDPYTNSSSKTNGNAKARANGQPRIAPVANAKVATNGFWLFERLEGAIAYAEASVVVYMANDDGRKAEDNVQSRGSQGIGEDSPVEAFHMPALNANMKNKYRPTRTLIFSTTAR